MDCLILATVIHQVGLMVANQSHCGDYHRPCYRRLADSALPEVDSCLSAGSNGMVFHGPNANLKQRDSHPTIFG